jgi:leucine dehydrogenase
MRAADNPSFDQHETVTFFDDEQTGLSGVIAVHSTALGPAAGGCRMATYANAEAALTDALRLSQGMSYKNALAELPAGGGKAVIFRASSLASREAIFSAFGAAVEAQGGAYVTAEDVGTTVDDMRVVRRQTRHVAGLPQLQGRAGGDPSPWTALGVFVAMEAAIGGSLAGKRVAVQGLGSVGAKLCARLHAAGASLVVADVDREKVEAAQLAFDAEAAPVHRIHAVDADVFSPNALGAVLNAETVPELGAPLVCGGANNQLADACAGRTLAERGVTFAPDYVANAGGIINVMAEHLGEPGFGIEARVRRIGSRVAAILAEARETRRPSHEVADAMARARIGRAGLSSAA